MFHLSVDSLVTIDWFPSMNDLVPSDMKTNYSFASDNHWVSLLLEVENVIVQYDLMHSIVGGPKRDTCCQCVRCFTALSHHHRHLRCEHLSSDVTFI